MADTQRSRGAILGLFADNTTGNIDAQDLRDFVVTMMELEFAVPGDFWAMPSPEHTATDKTGRGWKIYSQIIDSAVSFGNVVARTVSNTWRPADAINSALNYELGVVMDSYAAAESQATILMRGIVYNSTMSARFSGAVGRPVYLQSALAGSVSITANLSARYLGVVLPASRTSTESRGKWYFDPVWTVTGV